MSGPHVGDIDPVTCAVWDGLRWVAPVASRTAQYLTEFVFDCARASDFYRAVTRIDGVLEEVRAQAYEAGRAAAQRERAA